MILGLWGFQNIDTLFFTIQMSHLPKDMKKKNCELAFDIRSRNKIKLCLIGSETAVIIRTFSFCWVLGGLVVGAQSHFHDNLSKVIR